MKKDPLLKLYDKTPPKVLAALAIRAIMRLDESEHEKILSAVPKAIYRTYHADFIHRSMMLLGTAQLWSLFYWRFKALEFMHFGYILANPDMPPEKSDRYINNAQKFTSMLRVLDSVLDELADETGLDAATVRQWAEIPNPNPEPLTDAEQAEAQKMLESWLKPL